MNAHPTTCSSAQGVTCLLVTAFETEARPLIDHYRLSSISQSPFKVFGRDDMKLVVTGIGKLDAAAATAAVLSQLQGKIAVANIGICGSDRAIGEVFRANKICDNASGQNWYPINTRKKPLPGISIHTLDAPSSDYRADVGYDMEASGIFNTASRFLSNELIEIIKIISDNPSTPLSRLNGKSGRAEVIELINHQINLISDSISQLCHSASQLPTITITELLVDELVQSVRLSISQQHALKRLLQRHHALTGDLPSITELTQLSGSRYNASTLINALENLTTDFKTVY